MCTPGCIREQTAGFWRMILNPTRWWSLVVNSTQFWQQKTFGTALENCPTTCQWRFATNCFLTADRQLKSFEDRNSQFCMVFGHCNQITGALKSRDPISRNMTTRHQIKRRPSSTFEQSSLRVEHPSAKKEVKYAKRQTQQILLLQRTRRGQSGASSDDVSGVRIRRTQLQANRMIQFI